jgi:hypothetical protein
LRSMALVSFRAKRLDRYYPDLWTTGLGPGRTAVSQ